VGSHERLSAAQFCGGTNVRDVRLFFGEAFDGTTSVTAEFADAWPSEFEAVTTT